MDSSHLRNRDLGIASPHRWTCGTMQQLHLVLQRIGETETLEENWEGVLCPFCNADLEDWWGDAMASAHVDGGFPDLAVATPGLAARAVKAVVERAASHGERWSDHAPVTVAFEM